MIFLRYILYAYRLRKARRQWDAMWKRSFDHPELL